jgi:YfiH family protein
VTSLAAEVVDEFTPYGVRAFTTGRAAGSFSTTGLEPVRDVMARWDALRTALRSGGPRLATARQVHGSHVVVHGPTWEGWLRCDDADGHVAMERGTAMAVSIADCVPVFIVHPSGAAAILHSGWRGTAGRIVEQGIAALTLRGVPAKELRIHLGPAICGRCYEVSPEVYERLTGAKPPAPRAVDLRALIADQARASGVGHISISDACTRCNNERFYSHRGGDTERQLGVLIADR